MLQLFCITVATVLSAAVTVNFENFFRAIQVGNCVRLFSKKIFVKLRRLIFKKIFTYLLKKIIIFKMRVSAIQWSKLFIEVLPTHKYMYTSSTTTLQLCTTNLAILITAVSGIVRLLIKFLQYCPVRLLTLVRLLSPAGN